MNTDKCNYQIGQRVYWRGQFGTCSGVVMEITQPENSGYVLRLDIGDDAETYQLESNVDGDEPDHEHRLCAHGNCEECNGCYICEQKTALSALE